MAAARYAIAVGSNRRGRHGSPVAGVRAALATLGGRASPIVASAPLGPSCRRYANAVTLVDSDDAPDALLARLGAVEHAFGRRRGRRWGARVIDPDIILWSGGPWADPGAGAGLTVPHTAFRARDFVLRPLTAVAAGWRDPVSGLTVRQLRHRLTARAPLPRPHIRDGRGP